MSSRQSGGSFYAHSLIRINQKLSAQAHWNRTAAGRSRGLAAGAAEALFEKVSVERLLSERSVRSMRDLLAETLKQAGTEASEEMLTEVSNLLSDAAIMGSGSNFAARVERHRQEGLSEEAARRRAFLDCLSQVAWAGAGGALSGGVMGGTVRGANYLSGVLDQVKNARAAGTTGQNHTASTEQAGEYRANRPQNVELPNVPIINLSMQSVADMNGGVLPQTGNALRKDAIARARIRLGLDKNSAAYIPASNVTRNGDEYVLKITKASLNKMLSPADGNAVQTESIVVLDNIERIANNGVWFDSQGDRKGRPQINGIDHLKTVVYIDGIPYEVDMRVRLVQENAHSGQDNVLYYFTPEEVVAIKKVDTAPPTGERRALTGASEGVSTFAPIISENPAGGNARSARNRAGVTAVGDEYLQQALDEAWNGAEGPSVRGPQEDGIHTLEAVDRRPAGLYDGNNLSSRTGGITNGREEGQLAGQALEGNDTGGTGGAVLRDGTSRIEPGGVAQTEGRASFLARKEKEGATVRTVGASCIAYQEAAPEGYRPETVQAVRDYQAFGIQPIVVDSFERNSGGRTIRTEDAVTGPGGEVYLVNGSTIDSRNSAAHEAFHVGLERGLSSAQRFYEMVQEADILDGWVSEYLRRISDTYFEKTGRRFDPRSESDMETLMHEFAAFVSGAINDGTAWERFSSGFSDFNALESQWQVMREEMSRAASENSAVQRALEEGWRDEAPSVRGPEGEWEGEVTDRLRRAAKSIASGGRVVGFEGLPGENRSAFQAGLAKAAPEAGEVLKRVYPAADYQLSSGKRSYYRGMSNVVEISRDAEASTLAHELFHQLDADRRISSTLMEGLIQDYVALSVQSGGDIEGYLLRCYPSILIRHPVTKKVRFSEEYRGISDIINGLSGGTINFGYYHKSEYWKRTGSLEAEAWAQFGRMQYENNPEVLKMLSELFPNFTRDAMMALKGLV